MSATLRSLRRIPVLPTVALPLAMAAMAAVQLRPAPPLQAADLGQWVAGDRVSVTATAETDEAAAMAAHVGGLERALGLDAAASRRFAVVDDRFHQRQLDEVTYLDVRGSPIGLVRLDADGRLASAVRLGYRDAFALGRLDASGALLRGTATAQALGIPLPTGAPAVRPAMNRTLWSVSWPRLADGVPVDGDGLTIRLWLSGDPHSVTVSERPLERAPVAISPSAARAILDGELLDLLVGERLADGTIGLPMLHWVAPNDRFRPAGADAPAASLRLAYVFEMRFHGESAALVQAVTFWIDAATGTLIGGDVLR